MMMGSALKTPPPQAIQVKSFAQPFNREEIRGRTASLYLGFPFALGVEITFFREAFIRKIIQPLKIQFELQFKFGQEALQSFRH
jgi:hypothetical protein